MPPKFIAIIICLIFIFAFFGLSYAAFILVFGKKFLTKHFSKTQLKLIILFLGFEVMFGAYIVSKYNSVYTYDSAGYWTWSYTHMQTLFASPKQGLTNLWNSIIENDYNLILPTIIALPLKVFGYTFPRYVFINYCMFVIPASFIFLCLFRKLFTISSKKSPLCWPLAFSVPYVFFLSGIMPVFKGYIDVAILIPIFLIVSSMLKYNPALPIKKNIKTNILLSILLCVTFLCRRYTAFFIVGFFVALLAKSLLCIFTKKASSKSKRFKECFINVSSIGLVSSFVILSAFHGLVFRILKDDYSTLYSAYSFPLSTELLAFASNFSIPFICLALVGAFLSIFKKKRVRFVTFLAVNIIFTVSIFLTVQIMGAHHSLIIIPSVTTLIILGLNNITHYLRQSRKTLLLLPISLFFLIQIPYGCTTRLKLDFVFVPKFPRFSRYDLSTLNDLKDYINSLNTDNNIVYVLSSSHDFNYGTLANLDKPYKELAVNNVALTYDVDLRDGFPDPLMAAKYVVVPSPTQTHLVEGSQETIRWFSELIKDKNSFFGQHFKKLDRDFVIDYGITVSVYEKVSELNHDDYQQIYDYFTTLYPDAQTIYKNRIESYLN